MRNARILSFVEGNLGMERKNLIGYGFGVDAQRGCQVLKFIVFAVAIATSVFLGAGRSRAEDSLGPPNSAARRACTTPSNKACINTCMNLPGDASACFDRCNAPFFACVVRKRAEARQKQEHAQDGHASRQNPAKPEPASPSQAASQTRPSPPALPPESTSPSAANLPQSDRETCARPELWEAIAACSRLINQNPSDAVSYHNRGTAYYLDHDYDHAIADYSQAIRLDPRDASAHSHRGDTYEKKRDYARAIADYDQSLKLDPYSAIAREGRERVQALLTANRPGAPATQAQLPSQTSPPQPTTTQSQLPPQAPSPQPVMSAIPAERRVALVIGNSGYTSSFVPALSNPQRDAKVVADALRHAGFEVMELVDQDRTGVVKALQSFRDEADSADWALIYFAGHGIEVNRVNYLIPVDAKLADSRDVKYETVSYEDFADAIGGARALRIIILDACRSNPFKAQMRQTEALRGNLDRGLAAPPETKPGTLVVYSAKEGQAAVDGDGINSPFALAFVTELKVPGRDVRRMFDFVRDDVLEATSKRQQPYTYGSLPASRDFFFVAGK
jgi:tetratricopeptide (TPR) repeat protein